MIKIIIQELEIEKGLKQRLEFICEFCHIKPNIINGSIRKIEHTNLSYVEPHKLIVKTLNNKIKEKDKEIEELYEENYSLKERLEYWKNKFISFINLIKHRIFQFKHRDKYFDLAQDLYGNQIINKDTFNDIKENYDYSKEHERHKSKDDFDISL